MGGGGGCRLVFTRSSQKFRYQSASVLIFESDAFLAYPPFDVYEDRKRTTPNASWPFLKRKRFNGIQCVNYSIDHAYISNVRSSSFQKRAFVFCYPRVSLNMHKMGKQCGIRSNVSRQDVFRICSQIIWLADQKIFVSVVSIAGYGISGRFDHKENHIEIGL